MRWEKIGRTVYGRGGSTTVYKSGDYHIESRKRPIPHANGTGSWLFTSYYLIVDGKETEFKRLKDAKEAAEKLEAGNNG